MNDEGGWRDIDEAPRDGTEVIVYDGEKSFPSVFFVASSDRDYGGEGGWCRAQYLRGGQLYEGVTVCVPQPIKWIPIPTYDEGDELC